MGQGFNAWYLETFLESAKETEAQPAAPIPRYLPGFGPPGTYLLDSF